MKMLVAAVSILASFSAHADQASPVVALERFVKTILPEGATRANFVGVSDKGQLCEVVLEKDAVAYAFFRDQAARVDSVPISEHYEPLKDGTLASLILNSETKSIELSLGSGERYSLSLSNSGPVFIGGKFSASQSGTCNLQRKLLNKTSSPFLLYYGAF